MIPEKILKKYDGFSIDFDSDGVFWYDKIILISSKWWRKNRTFKFRKLRYTEKASGFLETIDYIERFYRERQNEY